MVIALPFVIFLRTLRVREGLSPNFIFVGKPKHRLLLIGAGDAAEMIIREVFNNAELPYVVVGMVDDNPNKTGLKIHSVPVLGLVDDLEEHIKRSAATEVLIATPFGHRKTTQETRRYLPLFRYCL